jgi:hypothetical protein
MTFNRRLVHMLNTQFVKIVANDGRKSKSRTRTCVTFGVKETGEEL